MQEFNFFGDLALFTRSVTALPRCNMKDSSLGILTLGSARARKVA